MRWNARISPRMKVYRKQYVVNDTGKLVLK